VLGSSMGIGGMAESRRDSQVGNGGVEAHSGATTALAAVARPRPLVRHNRVAVQHVKRYAASCGVMPSRRPPVGGRIPSA